MIRGKAIFSALTAAMIAMGCPLLASAAVISFDPFKTGDVEKDLDPLKDPRVKVVLDNGGKSNDVAQQDFITKAGGITGWNFKDFRFLYDEKSDTLAMGINFFGIAGDADGNGDPGISSNDTLIRSGIDLPRLGGQESVAVAFFGNDATNPFLYAGVPADKSQSGPGLNGFNVTDARSPTGQAFGIERSFGQTNSQYLGALAFDPSKDHPDFEFTVKNFSKLPGLKVNANGDFTFGFRAYAGNIDDVIAGEDLFKTEAEISVPRAQVPDPSPVPEPATILAWTVIGGLAIGFRVRRQARRSR